MGPWKFNNSSILNFHFNRCTLEINFSFTRALFWVYKYMISMFSRKRTQIYRDLSLTQSRPHSRLILKMAYHHTIFQQNQLNKFDLGVFTYAIYKRNRSTFGMRIWVPCAHLHFRWNAHYIWQQLYLHLASISQSHFRWDAINPNKHNTQSHYTSDEIQSTQPNITHDHILPTKHNT